MNVFLDTLVEVGHVQIREKHKAAAEKDPPAPVELSEADAKAQTAKQIADAEPFLNVQQDLVMRAMHCCFGDGWPCRLGGIAALEALCKRVPQRWLVRAASYIIKALMGVLRSLPDNAAQEQEEITDVLLGIVRRALSLPETALDSFNANNPTPPGPTETAPEAKETAMDVEQEPEEEAPTGRRGKRTKRGGAQPQRKRQQRQSAGEESSPPQPATAAAAEPSTPGDGAGPREDDPINEAARRLQNDLLGAVVSSKSNDAVRNAGTKCLQMLTRFTGLTVGALIRNMLERQHNPDPATASGSHRSTTTGAGGTPQPQGRQGGGDPRTPGTHAKNAQQTSRLGSLLERKMLPLRTISTQTNYAHSTAFLLRTCAEQLEFTPSLATFLADCCTIVEQEDSQIAQSTVVRGQAPKPEVITKLHIACMEVLVAALNWPAFLTAGDVKIAAHPWGQLGESSILGQKLRERMAKVFISKLGSTHDKVVELATTGLKLTVAKNLLEKSVLHEGLRPILMDLAMYQRMTVQLLRHVHRLLVSFSYYSFSFHLGNFT